MQDYLTQNLCSIFKEWLVLQDSKLALVTGGILYKTLTVCNEFASPQVEDADVSITQLVEKRSE